MCLIVVSMANISVQIVFYASKYPRYVFLGSTDQFSKNRFFCKICDFQLKIALLKFCRPIPVPPTFWLRPLWKFFGLSKCTPKPKIGWIIAWRRQMSSIYPSFGRILKFEDFFHFFQKNLKMVGAHARKLGTFRENELPRGTFDFSPRSILCIVSWIGSTMPTHRPLCQNWSSFWETKNLTFYNGSLYWLLWSKLVHKSCFWHPKTSDMTFQGK